MEWCFKIGRKKYFWPVLVILYQIKLSIKCKGGIKTFSGMQYPKTKAILPLLENITGQCASTKWGSKTSRKNTWNPGNREPITVVRVRVSQEDSERRLRSQEFGYIVGLESN